ncbi:MAG: type II secretion system protein GspK [Polyangiaceae bacterium]
MRRLPRLHRRAGESSTTALPPSELTSAKRSERRGVALILVLGSITILTVMLAEFQDDIASETTATSVDRDALRAEYAARSAINLSRLLIATEPTIRTAIGPLLGMLLGTGSAPQIPVWEFSDRILGAFNDINGMAAFGSLSGVDPNMGKNLGMNGVRFEVNIIDEDSKINVNVAAASKLMQQRLALQLTGLMQGQQYDALFDQRDGDGQFSDRQSICSAIVDWADVDEDMFLCDPKSSTASGSAPEDTYYQMLKVPYRRKNAPYDSLAELHLVRGVSDDFYATFIDPDPDNPRKRNVTVWGQNGVNVNSANAQTLYGLICAYAVPDTKMCNDVETAAKFITAVNLVRSFTSGAPLFPKPRTFVKALQGEGMVGSVLKDMLQLDPVQFTSASEFEKNITTKSERFSIYADGIVPSTKRETKVRIHAVVDFRGAPPPGYAPGTDPAASGSGAANALPTSTATATPTNGNTQALAPAGSAGMSADAIAGALMPNAGGQIVYYRIE